MPSPTRPINIPENSDHTTDSVAWRDQNHRTRIRSQRTVDKTDSAGFQVQVSTPESQHRESMDHSPGQTYETKESATISSGVYGESTDISLGKTYETKEPTRIISPGQSYETKDPGRISRGFLPVTLTGRHEGNALQVTDDQVLPNGNFPNGQASDKKGVDLDFPDSGVYNGNVQDGTAVEQQTLTHFQDYAPPTSSVFVNSANQNGFPGSQSSKGLKLRQRRKGVWSNSMFKSSEEHIPDTTGSSATTGDLSHSEKPLSIDQIKMRSDGSRIHSLSTDVFDASIDKGAESMDAKSTENSMSSSNTHKSLASPLQFHTPNAETGQPRAKFEFAKPAVPFASYKDNNDDLDLQQQLQQQGHHQPLRRQLSKRKNEISVEEVQRDTERESTPIGVFFPSSFSSSPSTDSDDNNDDQDFFSLPSLSPRTPTSPKPSRKNYDPYQIFEVLHTPCLILTVTVIRGRNITMGFQDLYDTPDPFLKLIMRSSPEGKKWTTVKNDQTNPVWNETFTFYVNFQQANILEINLMEYNSIWFNQLVGTVYFDLVNINEMGVRQLETFVFNGISQVDIEFLLEFDRNPTLRYSLCLSDQEKEFIKRRKENVLPAMNVFLGETDGPACVEEVPSVAVIGSGGGFRAMTAYSGVFKALVESGILDCSTYVCGLSGSSWFLSTLYSHPRWPDQLDMSEFLEEIMNKMDKKLLRFLNASTLYTFYKIMAEKRQERQPVSFTDIFGRMVGETLIPDRMESTLTAQREKIKEGASPMPLYTCVHVKKDVPAKSFQEWVEFSPYEIGMPKYGTFMDSALFGSKFFMGKLVKQYKEQPLHFLQGIWGSAFCILFKRLFEDNSRIDPAEMLREQLQEQLVEDGKNSSSDCSDDDSDNGDDGNDNWSSADSDASSVIEVGKKSVNGSDDKDIPTQKSPKKVVMKEEMPERKMTRFMTARDSQDLGSDEDSVDNMTDKTDSAYEGEEEDDHEDEDEDEDEMDVDEIVKPGILKKIRKGSLETKLLQKQLKSLQNLAGQKNIDAVDGKILSSSGSSQLDQSDCLKKSVNWGECPKRRDGESSKVTEQRRSAYKRAGSSMRKSRSGSKSYWKGFIKSLVESNSWEILSTRQGRAAVIHNFMRGLNLQQTYPISPFTPIDQRVIEGDEFKGNFEMHSTSVKHIYMVDAGLTFNSPYPLVLRPQRQVDIILSFDFSARCSDGHQPFKELLLAEKWAKLNRLPFPPIDASVFEREGMKELYIFRHPTDPHCPIVFHFPLVNKTFRDFKAPGVPRQTEEEVNFANFDIFDDPNAPYSTFNFTYTHESFKRLSQLTEYNTLKHVEDIRQVMKEVVTKKRVLPPRVPIQSKDIKLLRMKSVQEMRKLRKFITRMESRSSVSGSTRPCSARAASMSSNNMFFPNSPHGQQRNMYSSFSTSQDSSPVFSSSPKDKLACFTSASFCTSKDFGNDMMGASLPSSLIHRMRQQQQQHQQQEQQQQDQQQQAEQQHNGKPIPQPRQPLTSTDSVYGTPPSDMESTPEPGSSPRQSLTSQGSVYGTPPKDNAEWLSFYRGRRLSNINEDSIDSTRSDFDELPIPEEPNSSVRKKPKIITCSEQPLTIKADSVQSPLPGTSPKSVKSRSPSPSPKLKIPTQFAFEDLSKPGSESGGKPSSNGSSGSSGVWSMTSGSGSTTAGSGKFTPAALDLLKKKKTRKESPPNPFFRNAHFMRSTLSSGSSNSSLGVLDDKPVKFERGKSYRLSPQPPAIDSTQSSNSSVEANRFTFRTKSPLAQDKTLTQSQVSASMSRLQSQVSSNEEFHNAPSAFKADGTPVVDPNMAKMFYDSAKNKRKLFRRQSTVSSLNSISLEDKNSKPDSTQGLDGEETEDMEEQPSRFRELFLSLEQQSNDQNNDGRFNSLSSSNTSERFFSVNSDTYNSVTEDSADVHFDPDIMDLSQFGSGVDVNDTETDRKDGVIDIRVMDTETISPMKAPVGHSQTIQHQVTKENSDIWFDAKPCLS